LFLSARIGPVRRFGLYTALDGYLCLLGSRPGRPLSRELADLPKSLTQQLVCGDDRGGNLGS
jgi:hypothetical protein